MKNPKPYIAFIPLLLLVVSCTKVIDLKLKNDAGELVIEGKITNMPGPQSIMLSTNVPFTSTNSYPQVTGATVTVSDQAGNSYKLIEGPAGTYTAYQLAGVAGSIYLMNVSTNGKNYKASSQMPAMVLLDSVTSKTSGFDKKRRQVTVHYQDPAGTANQYRFVVYINYVQVKAIFAYNDNYNDGKYVNIDLREDNIDVYPDDIVQVEMQCIDKVVYTYWFTQMQQEINGPGGGVTPSNAPNNISPNALGYFSAHTTQTKTIVVK